MVVPAVGVGEDPVLVLEPAVAAHGRVRDRREAAGVVSQFGAAEGAGGVCRGVSSSASLLHRRTKENERGERRQDVLEAVAAARSSDFDDARYMVLVVGQSVGWLNWFSFSSRQKLTSVTASRPSVTPNAIDAAVGQIAPNDARPQSIANDSSPGTPTTKRKPGRPRGAASKLDQHGPKRPPGRPKGSGKRQVELIAQHGDPQVQVKAKRGRPRKDASKERVVVDFGRFPLGSPDPAPETSDGLTGGGVLSSSTSPPLAPQSPNRTSGASATQQSTAHNDASESDTADLKSQADGNGLGDDLDDLGGREEEAHEDGDGEAMVDEATAEGESPQPRIPHPTPPWLLKAFKKWITECEKRDANGLPPPYATYRTIFLPRPSTSFLLRNLAKASPQALYNPRFVLWDPMPLCPLGIPCPKCKVPLQRHTHIPRPRRVVDFVECFWLIGYRYRCRSCKCTFRSWDKRILDVLPPTLAYEFPARLSHRSGMSKKLMEWVRMCFHGGMGAKQVSDSLRHQHLVHYDTLRLQYFHQLQAARGVNAWLGRAFDSFNLRFEDRTPMGYHGYVPSGQYIREMFDVMIEEHRDEYHQHMAMLPLTIAAADHSHKLTKQILRVGGQEALIGVHCITNEFSEIQACHLVTTKGHSQTELALKGVKESLERYGHEMPQVFFTDNMADKGLLEEVFPSLTEDVVPADKYGHLDELQIPDDVHVFVKETVRAIDLAIETILDDLDLDGAGELVVGFDTEWNVETSPNGQVKRTGKTAIAQIAYKKQIYILQISDMVAEGTLPAQLRNLLANPHVLKVGRNVGRDLKLLEEACHSTEHFVGGLDLAKYAKERSIMSRIKDVGLADLSAIFLRKRINKNVPERISERWEEDALTDRQKRYAAVDAYASLRIYDEISKFSPPAPVSDTMVPTPATPVLLYAPDKSKVIAVGEISLHSLGNAFDNIQLNPGTTVIDVFHVILPGAKVKTHRKKALHDFGSTPFSVIVPKSSLRTYESPSDATFRPYDPQTTCVHPASTTGNAQSPQHTQPHPASGSSLPGQEIVNVEAALDSVGAVEENKGTPLGDLILDGDPDTQEDDDEVSAHHDADTSGYARDEASAAEGAKILGDVPAVWNTVIRSRVLKDVFHLFNQFYISVKHGLRLAFVRALRDALFLFNEDDNGAYNRTGKRYRGHFSPWIINELQDLSISLREVLTEPCEFPGHVNGTYYTPTSERIGILPVPPATRADGGMLAFDPSMDGRRKHHHLAMLQGVSKAVLPVHTDQERDLFHALMQAHPAFSTPNGEPNWKEAH
ncbi:hypothetical protein D9611_014996 [Ephemerocybe angulata]|uniref:3'-5' exonuclease n=1 Tax=Ephemerocybe angulata TaxID=980116 RepID=A0A8H5C3S0_9AGAR|nr:hypothetical protein D9611_014996 [Tulosesus angulatus]